MKKNFKYFMKSRSNSSNKVEANKCLKLKPSQKTICSSRETVCHLCLQRLSYQSTKTLFKKRRSSKTQRLNCNTLGSQLGLLRYCNKIYNL